MEEKSCRWGRGPPARRQPCCCVLPSAQSCGAERKVCWTLQKARSPGYIWQQAVSGGVSCGGELLALVPACQRKPPT